MNLSENLTTDTPNPEPTAVEAEPAHRYVTHEGDEYGYVAAVSEEDQKRGRAAGDVLMYRYEGVHDGLYELTAMSGEGRPTYSYECAHPCTAIKVYTGQGIERWEFNPDSVIGAAFTDAFNGQLVPTRRKRATLPPPGDLSLPSDQPENPISNFDPAPENAADGE